MSSTSQKTTNHLDSSQFTAMRAFIARRQDEIIDLICKLIEAESPSGDFEGSRKVVDLLVEAARAIPAIDSVERIPVPGYGEHFRARAFGSHPEGAGATLLLGHTDTVHPRGALFGVHSSSAITFRATTLSRYTGAA